VSGQWTAPDAAPIEAFEANLIAHSVNPYHAEARFSASVVQFDNGSALNDRWGVLQASATAADVVREDRLLKFVTGEIDPGQLHFEPDLMAWIDTAGHTVTSVTLYSVTL
jgi:hypothetical protein